MNEGFKHNFHVPLTDDERRKMWAEVDARIALKQSRAANETDPLKAMGYIQCQSDCDEHNEGKSF